MLGVKIQVDRLGHLPSEVKIKVVESCIEKLYKQNYKEKHTKNLELAIIRL